MIERRAHRRLFLAALTISSALVCAGCTSPPASSMEDRFLEATGSTWRVAGEPMVFERTEARFSRSARDYTYIGPVALNRRGTYDYYLWIGIGSTLDRGFLAPEATEPDSVLLYIDGEPLDLALSKWNQRIPDLADQIPYDPPVTVRSMLAARVTLDQIALLSDRGIDRLLLQTADNDTREFRAWGTPVSWGAFVAQSP